MLEFKATMGANGRILLPAKCRKALHLSPGETVIIRVEGEEGKICSANTAIRRAQKIVAQALKGKKSLVDELIKTRRIESDNE